MESHQNEEIIFISNDLNLHEGGIIKYHIFFDYENNQKLDFCEYSDKLCIIKTLDHYGDIANGNHLIRSKFKLNFRA